MFLTHVHNSRSATLAVGGGGGSSSKESSTSICFKSLESEKVTNKKHEHN